MEKPLVTQTILYFRNQVDWCIKDPALKKTCDFVLNDDRFWKCPGSLEKHQAYEGGLAEHTRQVMDLSLSMAESYIIKDKADKQIIIAGVLWHDYGKIWDYEAIPWDSARVEKARETGTVPQPIHRYTPHRFTIRHLPRSYAEFWVQASKCQLDPQIADDVGHVILAHHGRLEWQSPVVPQTLEAQIVHSADIISARFVEESKDEHAEHA